MTKTTWLAALAAASLFACSSSSNTSGSSSGSSGSTGHTATTTSSAGTSSGSGSGSSTTTAGTTGSTSSTGTTSSGSGSTTASTTSSTSSGSGSGSGSTTSSTSSGSTSTGSGSGSTGGTTGGGLIAVYSCDPTTATDMTAQSSVTIDFGGTLGLSYSPSCVKVKAGTTVTFAGSFSSHPLRPGDLCVDDTSGTSPITSTATGSSQAFTFSNPGTYPYFCHFHCGSGMNGAVYVVP